MALASIPTLMISESLLSDMHTFLGWICISCTTPVLDQLAQNISINRGIELIFYNITIIHNPTNEIYFFSFFFSNKSLYFNKVSIYQSDTVLLKQILHLARRWKIIVRNHLMCCQLILSHLNYFQSKLSHWLNHSKLLTKPFLSLIQFFKIQTCTLRFFTLQILRFFLLSKASK